EQYQQPIVIIAREIVVQAHDANSESFVCDRILLFDASRDRIHLRLCFGETDAVAQTRNAVQTVVRARKQLRSESERYPKFCDLRKPETTRHDADHRTGAIAECDLLPNDVWVAAKIPLPQIVSKDHYRVFVGPIFVSSESTSELRRNTQNVKDVVGDASAAYFDRFSGASQRKTAAVEVRSDVLE